MWPLRVHRVVCGGSTGGLNQELIWSVTVRGRRDESWRRPEGETPRGGVRVSRKRRRTPVPSARPPKWMRRYAAMRY